MRPVRLRVGLLDERLGLAVLAGGALVIAGVWLTSYQKGKTT